MIWPPIFQTLSQDAGVTALLGSNPCRVFPQGEAPDVGTDGYAEPFAVFQQISGSPANYLGTLPESDDSGNQIDVYGRTVQEAITVAYAIMRSVEPHAYVVSVLELGKDSDTNLSRVSITVEWITHRI